MKRKKINPILGFGTGIVGLSTMSSTLGDIGGSVAEKGQHTIYSIAKFAPAMGTILGGGLVLGAMDRLPKAIPRASYRKKRLNIRAVAYRKKKISAAAED